MSNVIENVCEHGDHPAPPNKRFCSDACAQCELVDFDATRQECAGICQKRPDRRSHFRGPGGRPLCKTRGKTPPTMARSAEDVTCRICVYQMLERGDISEHDPRVTAAMREHLRNPETRTSAPSARELKVHKRDRFDATRATCGAKPKSGALQLSDNNDEVTCLTCRGWFPVPERPLPTERSKR